MSLETTSNSNQSSDSLYAEGNYIPAKAFKAKKKVVKVKKAAVEPAHPSSPTMISTAIGALKERGGSSRPAILEYVLDNYKIIDENKGVVNFKLAIRKMLAAGTLISSKGLFKLSKVKEPKKKSAKELVKQTIITKLHKTLQQKWLLRSLQLKMLFRSIERFEVSVSY